MSRNIHTIIHEQEHIENEQDHTHNHSCMSRNIHTINHAYNHSCTQTLMHTYIHTYNHEQDHKQSFIHAHNYSCILTSMHTIIHEQNHTYNFSCTQSSMSRNIHTIIHEQEHTHNHAWAGTYIQSCMSRTMKLCFRIQARWLDKMSWTCIGYRSAKMLKVADGRSVQGVVAQPPLLGKSLSKVNDSRQRYKAYDKLL
jgi:hypothetical protein